MSYFPFFREIEGEKCLVIGGGKVAARKISRLKGFGVKIKVVAPSIVSDIEAVVQACDNISVERRIFTPQDIENVDFVIAAAVRYFEGCLSAQDEERLYRFIQESGGNYSLFKEWERQWLETSVATDILQNNEPPPHAYLFLLPS